MNANIDLGNSLVLFQSIGAIESSPKIPGA